MKNIIIAFFLMLAPVGVTAQYQKAPVSYTHLDVYKRQIFTEDLMQDMLDWQAAGGGSTGGVKASSNGQWGKPDYEDVYKRQAHAGMAGGLKSTSS